MVKGPKSSNDPQRVALAGGVKKSGKKLATSKSAKAGLCFPVARINRRLVENKSTKRVGGGAPVFMTAVLELFAAEIIEIAIAEMKASGGGRSRITPVDVLRAVRNDEQVNKATNGLRVMVGDKAKDTADLITSKTDMETKYVAKMREAEWFEYNAEHTIELNYKRFLKELKSNEDAQGA
jgi:histone H2A